MIIKKVYKKKILRMICLLLFIASLFDEYEKEMILRLKKLLMYLKI